jgi:hypothetical protein
MTEMVDWASLSRRRQSSDWDFQAGRILWLHSDNFLPGENKYRRGKFYARPSGKFCDARRN